MSKPKRSKEWRLAKELYEVGARVRFPEREWTFEAHLSKGTDNPKLAEKAWLAVVGHILKNFTRKK